MDMDERTERQQTMTAAAARADGAAADGRGAVLAEDLAGGPADAPPRPEEDGSRGRVPLVQQPDEYRRRWEGVQAGFVDEPRRSVEMADQLVAEVMEAVARSFAEVRGELEAQWSGGGEASTEDLRISM